MKKYTPIILGVITGLLIHGAYHKGYEKGVSKAVERVITIRDTLIRVDTVTRPKPVYIAERIVDSIPYYIHITDTISVLAYLPRTEREYGDSTYHAVVSGVEPSLDRIDIFQKTQYINNTVYVPTKDTRKDFVELNAKFLYDRAPLMPITIDIGYRRGLFEVYAGAGYDVLQKTPVGEVGTRLRLNF